MALTIEKSIEYHRELWNWLAENPKNDKEDWPGWKRVFKKYPELMKSRHIVSFCCFACYATKQITPGDCADCVLEWPGKDCFDDKPDDEKGLYLRWYNAKTPKTSKKLAIQIRDLPVRKPREEGEATNETV